MKSVVVRTVLSGLFLLGAVQGFTAPAESEWARLAAANRSEEALNGSHTLSVFLDGTWREIGNFPGGKDFTSTSVRLRELGVGEASGELRLRISESGGGAAHVDALTVDGHGPVSVSLVGDDDTDPLLLKKLQSVDHDVVDSFGRTFELVFPVGASGTVVLNARVEAERIGTIPFSYPKANLYTPVSSRSSFYSYDLGTRSTFSKEPDFRVYDRPGSGHPPGWTSGWNANDEKSIRFRLDFTPDNTFDGNKDYAKIYVLQDDGVRVFTQSMSDLAYGTPAFTYTDTVSYQHKVYEFSIPLSEVQLTPGSQTLRYAVEAYGTAAPPSGEAYPFLAFDASRNRYLLVYASDSSGSFKPYAQYYSWDVIPIGEAKLLSMSQGAYAADSGNLPSAAFAKDGSALVVWPEYDGSGIQVWARRLNPAGVPEGGMIELTTLPDYSLYPHPCSVAYDPGTNKFLVVWEGNGVIMGARIAATAGAGPENIGDIGYVIGFDQSQPQVVNANGEYLVTWVEQPPPQQQTTGSKVIVQKVPAAGAVQSSAVPVASSSLNNVYEAPSVAYDSDHDQFLVVWAEVGQAKYINGALLNSSGNPSGSIFPVSAGTGSDEDRFPNVVYSPKEGLYIVTWNRSDGTGTNNFYQQKVDYSGSLYGIANPIAEGADHYYFGGAALAVNTQNGDNLSVAAVVPQNATSYGLEYNWYDYPNGPAPQAPALSSPADEATVVGPEVPLQWEAVPESGISYRVYYSTNSVFTKADFTAVASGGPASSVTYALAGSGILALLVAGVMATGGTQGAKKRRTVRTLIMVLLVVLLSVLVLSCPTGMNDNDKGSNDDKDDDGNTPPDEAVVVKDFMVTDLSPGTTYYWKVVADNGEALAESEVWSFTTTTN